MPRMNLQAISQLAELCDYSFAFALRAVAAIGVADHLAGGPLHINELAERTQCNPHSLVRALRMLAMKSVFTEETTDTFALAPAGQLLRTDHPLSMRWFFRLEPDVHALAALDYSIRTGRPAFEHVFNSDYHAWLASADEHRRRFHESQRALDRLELIAIERAFRSQDATVIVDLDDAEISRDEVPAGADVYVMKRILSGFSDEEAILALSRVRRAMAAHSRLLVVEPLRNTPHRVGVSLDLQMLVLGLGRVRAADEIARLLIAAGLRTTATHPAEVVTIMEAEVRPARAPRSAASIGE
jgi:hypothetical protein